MIKTVSALTTGVAIVVLSIAPARAKDLDTRSQWPGEGITVDGRMNDWEHVPTRFLEDQEAVLGVANDSANLYVMLRFRDPMYARAVHGSGITLYLDNRGKKKKDFVLQFRGGPSMAEIRQLDTLRVDRRSEEGNQDRGDHMRDDRMQGRDSLRVPELICTVKDRVEDKSIPADGSEGPSAASGIDNGFFVYEFRIPLRPSEVRDYGLGATPGNKISVGIVWGEMKRPERGEGGGPGGMGGGMRPPGGGGGGGFPDGPGGGGMGGRPGGGGGMRGGRPGGMKMPEKQEVWVKATLASGGGEKN